ncbi:MAG TPA: phosphate ABC transporter substrate-binding protein PstS [Spirochaetia bacterium]|nr:phosphate ABC transporter substrate-binding protein PstS [Spirochaetia bacterium]
MKVSRLLLVAAMMVSLGGAGFAQTNEFTAAGATFPAPLYLKMFDQYSKEFGVKVNYQAIGSGGGQAQLKAKTVDFGASDVVMTAKDMADAPAEIVHVPTVAGAVVLVSNLPGNPQLKLTGDLIADIYLGKIKNWNDSRLSAINPDVKFPNLNITVVHRSDGSGTTGVFSDYLCKISPEWKDKVGTGTSLSWPVGIGGKGNPGVAGLVKQLPGAFGYVELIYSLQNNIPFALLKNKSGNWIKASLESTSAAANVPVPEDVTKLSLTNTDASQGYPISTFTWLILYKEQSYDNHQRAKVEAMLKMMWWMTHDGQKYAEPLSYAVLPAPVVKKAEAILRSITFGGKPVLEAGM